LRDRRQLAGVSGCDDAATSRHTGREKRGVSHVGLRRLIEQHEVKHTRHWTSRTGSKQIVQLFRRRADNRDSAATHQARDEVGSWLAELTLDLDVPCRGR
jgi:hypothetical protein